MEYSAISFEEKLSAFSDHQAPKIVAQMNDYHLSWSNPWVRLSGTTMAAL